MEGVNQTNQAYWDALSGEWKALRDLDELWREIPGKPDLSFESEALELIRTFMGDLHGKNVLVIGSGDNYVTFALTGSGASVTSTNISSNQLAVARERAVLLRLDIEFTRADAAALEGIPSSNFDLVCSSNGLFVWIPEPKRVFEHVLRVLKPGGFTIFYDIHPFQRPWKDQVAPLEMEIPYNDTGPFIREDQGLVSDEFNRRLVDIINPLIDAGLVLRRIAESPAKDARFWEGHAYTPVQNPDLLIWRMNPRAGLPVWLSIAAQKPYQMP